MSRDHGTTGLVLIGVSTGGPRVLEDILPALPADLPWPVLVAQHMPASFTDTFARRLDKLCALRVREVDGTVPLEAGWIYVARGGTDMVVAERIGRLVAQARPEVPGHPWHPSVDVLVDSARRLLPPARLLGVLLTGMGYDGAAAMTALHAEGGRTIAESEETAVVFGMPHELIERGGASVVLPGDRIAGQIVHWITKQG
jgi:two-component system chemotaxis response regulator CheB